MQKEKIRVYVLARELKVETKDLLELCAQAGFEVKNQLSSLDGEQRKELEKLLHQRPRGGQAVADKEPTKTAAPAEKAAQTQPAGSPQPQYKAPEIVGRMRDLNQIRPRTIPTPTERDKRPVRKPPPPRSAVTAPGLAAPPKPKTPRPGKLAKDAAKAGKPPGAQRPIAYLPEDAKHGAAGKDAARGLIDKIKEKSAGVTQEEEEDSTGAGGTRPGAVKGRSERHKRRSQRAQVRRDRQEALLKRGQVLEDDEPITRLRHKLRRSSRGPVTQPRKGHVPIEAPITVRSLSEAIGVPARDIQRKLMDRTLMVTINAELEIDLSEELALEYGAELDIKREADPEELLLSKYMTEDEEGDLQPRAPIVTVMGHVDHGKTSLLDRIRESNVVDSEAGGITQHLRAWRVDHNGRPITFLDTPGHEAFTQMRARGANVTDVVVLVVAADDSIMPQTEEAISHAKAAGVPIIVAINKVDLPNANVLRARQDLYSRELLPDDMGGNSPFVETVATKENPRGIDELLEQIGLVAELMLDLKANPDKPASGVCLEANLTEGEGVVATLLVRDGTLRQGDILVCGSTHGRVRVMYDDQMRPIEEAGPTQPVRITGLDEAPNADDAFQVVDDLALARDVADHREDRERSAQPVQFSTFRLEDLDKAKVEELKLIVKADVRGSLEAIRKEMEKLVHDEVRVKILHAAIGGITESDIQLALASPKNTMVVGFNVVPDDRADSLAKLRNIQIRKYQIIYQLTDDIRAALEGKLKPLEEVVHLGRAVVRDTFKISRLGTIAGCHVTQGTIERSAFVQLIREGVVIYPPAGRKASLDSLKRFKDDVREVREGFECGIKIAGYDDVKVDDVIQAFRIQEVQRTLSA